MKNLVMALISVSIFVGCSGGSSSAPAPQEVPPNPTPPTSVTSYSGMPANFNGYYKGLTRWTTATSTKEVSIILAIKQNTVAITDISVFPGENSASIFDFGSYRTFEIIGNDLFERSSDQLSEYRYGKIGADGFYITDSDFAEIDVIKVAKNGIHLRMHAKQLSPTVFGTYEETQVKGVLFLIK